MFDYNKPFCYVAMGSTFDAKLLTVLDKPDENQNKLVVVCTSPNGNQFIRQFAASGRGQMGDLENIPDPNALTQDELRVLDAVYHIAFPKVGQRYWEKYLKDGISNMKGTNLYMCIQAIVNSRKTTSE